MLIFQNGMAYFDIPTSTSDIDENGLPIEGVEPTLSVPCYIEMLSEDRNGRSDDGVYPRFSMSLSFDYDSVGEDFKPTKVRVEHERKGDMGEYAIQRIEFYNLTRTIQVWV